MSLVEQIYKLGQRVEFHDSHRDTWVEGIVHIVQLMNNGKKDWIAYGCLADDGFSIDRLGKCRVREISAVKLLGDVVP